MVICNIIYDIGTFDKESDANRIRKYQNYPSINVITDITQLNTSVPTIFYGLQTAITYFGDLVKRNKKQINNSYCWTYNDSEIEFENWLAQFVMESTEKYFKFIDNGIDVVFDNFNLTEFIVHLNSWPLIHEGSFEIYVADWRDGNIIIHSVKKETLEYLGIDPKFFLYEMYELLNYEFLSIDAKSFDLMSNNFPIFLDDVLFANSDEWIGIDELIDYFSHIEIDRKKVITYYLKQSEYLRDKFDLYK